MREQTLLSVESVASRSTYLDWNTQPSLFKRYPHFCHRIKLSEYPRLQWLQHTRCISDHAIIAPDSDYYRLNVPSAGNLHPIEIYVQLRNIEGIMSGIYHFDVVMGELVMIAEIASEGIEPYVGVQERFNGAILMISLVPFRSYWKYGLRGWRYLYLDLGHQIGALGMSVHHFGERLTKMSPIAELNTIMGFGDDEVIGAVYGIGEISERNVKSLSKALIHVSPCDYTNIDNPLNAIVRSEKIYHGIPQTHWIEHFTGCNMNRRSARVFDPTAMSDTSMRALLRLKPPKTLEIIGIVLQAQSMQPGVYQEDVCIKSGDFLAESVHLLLNQRFIARANMVLLITAENFSASNHVDAGIYAQQLYLECETYGVGCSGIGAFYDDEAAQWSKYPLLYAVAIGGKR